MYSFQPEAFSLEGDSIEKFQLEIWLEKYDLRFPTLRKSSKICSQILNQILNLKLFFKPKFKGKFFY